MKWFNISTTPTDGYAAEVEINEGIGWWGTTAGDFIKQVKAIKGRVLVRINSGGGSVFDAVAIYNYLRSRKDGADTIVDGVAASAATLVMLAGEKRSMGTGSFVMVHRAMADTFGNAQELRKAAENLEKIEDGIKAIYAERTGADDETLAEWLDGEDHWLNADDAAQAGFVTETFEQLKAVASFDIQAKFKSAPPPVVAALTQPQQKDSDMKIVMKTLGLSEDANEAAVIEAVNQLKGDAQAAQD